MENSFSSNALGDELPPSEEPLPVVKLGRYAPLSARDRQFFARALSLDIRTVKVRSVVQEAFGGARKLAFLLSGWACCYRVLGDGRQHLVACYLPGDTCDLHSLTAQRRNTVLVLMAGARIANISADLFDTLHQSHPAIIRALWVDAHVSSSIEREWLVNVARRSARQRIAHLFAELAWRCEAAGELIDGRFQLPIPQSDFASACGLTPSHANRILRLLHEEGLVTWSKTVVSVHDRASLETAGTFSPDYLEPGRLHATRTPRRRGDVAEMASLEI